MVSVFGPACSADDAASDDGTTSTGGAASTSTGDSAPTTTIDASGTTESTVSGSESEGSTSTMPPSSSSSDGADSTSGGTAGPLDCDALCGPYEACDESVFLTCHANCENTARLDAYDAGCGAAAASYLECRFSLSCEDAITEQTRDPDPPACPDALATYIDTCLAAVPGACDPYCANLLPCLTGEDPPDPVDVDACAFECLLLHGHAAAVDDPPCDDALAATLTCVAEADCDGLDAGACDPASEDFETACGPF